MSSESMTRRELFRRGGTIAAGATATVTVGSRAVPRYSPIGRAAAVAPAIPIGIVAAGAAIAYFSGDALPFTGNSDDMSGYTGADALALAVYDGSVEMESADERVMTSIENNLQNSENVALAKGKNAIIEKMNAEAPESEAQTAMQNAIDEYYSSIIQNICTHYNEQIRQINHHLEQLANHSSINTSSSSDANMVVGFHGYDVANSEEGIMRQYFAPNSAYSNPYTITIEPLSGYPVDVDFLVVDTNTNTGNYNENPITSLYFARNHASKMQNAASADIQGSELYTDFPHSVVYHPPSEGNNYQHELPFASNTVSGTDDRIGDAIQQTLNKRDDVNAQLSGFVSDVYSAYEPGDIPTEDLIDPITAATELGQNYDDRGFRSAQAAILGIPTDANFTASLEIVSSDAEDGVWEVTADIFTEHVPRADITESASISSGTLTLTTEPTATITVTTTDGETVDVAAADFTESNGEWTADISGSLSTTSTSVDTALGGDSGFEVGRTYSPGSWDAPLYIAYSYKDEISGEQTSEFTQIESETTVVSATDVDGNDVQTFQTESQNIQTADVAALREELQQLHDAQIQMQSEAEAESGGGGGGLPSASGALIGIAVLIAGYLYIDSN